MNKTSKLKLFILIVSIVYTVLFFCIIFCIPALFNIDKITEITYWCKNIFISYIELCSFLLILSLIFISYFSRPEQINTITNIPYQWNTYKQKIDNISEIFSEETEKYKDKSNQFIVGISEKQKELEIMRMECNCNYRIYTNSLDLCYKTVFVTTADLKFRLYDICTHSDLGNIPKFMEEYEQYRNNLQELKNISYR